MDTPAKISIVSMDIVNGQAWVTFSDGKVASLNADEIHTMAMHPDEVIARLHGRSSIDIRHQR